MNYDDYLRNILESLESNRTYKVLLHSCCAPCSSYVLEYLTKYVDVSVYYYNPNIYPESEYIKRKNEEIRFISEYKGNHKIDFIDCDYNSKEYDEAVVGHENDKEGGSRCSLCFKLRMSKTAKLAKELGYDFFGTTLSVSPHKNSKIINEIGSVLEKEYDVKYLYSDFKKKEGYKRSIELSREYNLYRQNYCGCKYSIYTSKDE